MKLWRGLCSSLRSLAHKPRHDASRLKPMLDLQDNISHIALYETVMRIKKLRYLFLGMSDLKKVMHLMRYGKM